MTAFEVFYISMRTVEIMCCSSKDRNGHILCSSSSHQQDTANGLNIRTDDAEGCFLLKYERHNIVDSITPGFTILLNNIDLHCYPYVSGLLVGFYDRISKYGTSYIPHLEDENLIPVLNSGLEQFGVSNFLGPGSSEWASIPVDRFPFVTINNAGSLGSLDKSLIYPISEWRNHFSLRDKHIGSLKSRPERMCKTFPVLESKPSRLVDFNLHGVRVHFHDDSCIIGTFTLPLSKSSLSFHNDCVDVLCSTEGLVLTSPWWTQNFFEFLWGPSKSNLSPILNLRFKMANSGTLSSQLELSISVQHACCVLSPEYLAVIIGYFSLPEWTSNSSDQLIDSENSKFSIIYKFEILESVLILPFEGDPCRFLKLDIQQLYSRFIQSNTLDDLVMDIPLECLLSMHKLADNIDCLNLFGRELSLSLLYIRDDEQNSFKLDKNTGRDIITFAASLNADLWVRIPCEGDSGARHPMPTCVMMSVSKCRLIFRGGRFKYMFISIKFCVYFVIIPLSWLMFTDDYLFLGVEALMSVIDQLSSVAELSKCYMSNVLQLPRLKRWHKENVAALSDIPVITSTEVKCCFSSISIDFCRFRKDSIALEPVAMLDMQFLCYAQLRNEIPSCLELSFTSLVLYSMLSSVLLAQCGSTSSVPSFLDTRVIYSNEGEKKLVFTLPALDIWLHLLSWMEFIELFSSFAPLLESNTETVSQRNSELFTVKSENAGITFHIPVSISKNPSTGRQSKYIALTLESKNSQVVFYGQNVSFKSCLEKVSGKIQVCEDTSPHSWPLFHLVQVNVEGEICDSQTEVVSVQVEVQCDSLDVCLSHHAFFFFHGLGFEIPEAGSEIVFSGIDFEVKVRKVSLLLTDGRVCMLPFIA